MQQNMVQEATWRIAHLKALQEHYDTIEKFSCAVLTRLIGAMPTEMQLDIVQYIAYGPQYSMVQAQRGEAKTTFAGIYVVFSWIHDPTTRALVFSAGTSMSKDISNWIIQILTGMEELECLLPDMRIPGQRMSVEKFDVHYTLKGPEKSPSLACLGINSNMQGFRADILLADDIESSKNALTEEMREKLRQYMRDFPSICTSGKILYLGTPQSADSVYNDLVSLGFDLRVWPGRYPEPSRLEHYGAYLAPLVANALKNDPSLGTGGGLTGDRGQPTDPIMMDEEMLQTKELAQGAAYFDLQHMLDTRLTDAGRYPLKVSDIIFYSLDLEEAPAYLRWGSDQNNKVKKSAGAELGLDYFRASSVAKEFFPYTAKILSIDPAGGGQNGDETSGTVLYFMNGYIFLMDIVISPGGVDEEKLVDMALAAKKYQVNRIIVEQNFGNGAYAVNLRSVLQREDIDYQVTVEDIWVNQQKEKRIADTLEPIMGRHKLVINESVIDRDWQACQRQPLNLRRLYSIFFQMEKLTLDKGSLRHDDRLDSLAFGCAWLVDKMAVDEKKVTEQKRKDRMQQWFDDPLGHKKRKKPRSLNGRRLGKLQGRRTYDILQLRIDLW